MAAKELVTGRYGNPLFYVPAINDLTYGDRILVDGKVYRISGNRYRLGEENGSPVLVHHGYIARHMIDEEY